MRLFSLVLTAACAVSVCGCMQKPPMAPTAVAPVLVGDQAHPAQTSGWVDTRLYFGLGLADKPEQGIQETQWRAFLDREVTPRFPSGLSVLNVYGQWQGKSEAAPSRLRSKMLILYYKDTPENRAKVDAIRAAWKTCERADEASACRS